jgi:hypothetical protein
LLSPHQVVLRFLPPKRRFAATELAAVMRLAAAGSDKREIPAVYGHFVEFAGEVVDVRASFVVDYEEFAHGEMMRCVKPRRSR